MSKEKQTYEYAITGEFELPNNFGCISFLRNEENPNLVFVVSGDKGKNTISFALSKENCLAFIAILCKQVNMMWQVESLLKGEGFNNAN